jgi:hypothetical protein
MTRIFTVLIILSTISAPIISQHLKVSDNGRFLVLEDGTPFFYLGDTAWELLNRLDRDEVDTYLNNRAEKGFTVIQTVVLGDHAGLDGNAYGNVPLKDGDPAKPLEAYFEHVDYFMNKAESLGLIVGLLPSWGKYWSSLNPDQTIFNEENANKFGLFLGKRYKDKPLIWILGGDHNIHTEEDRKIVQSLAKGLKEGDEGNHLITFHPRGPGLSSDYFHNAEWLDFNMVQSSHAAHDHDNGLFIEHDYALEPAKPTLDGEPRYEAIQTGFYFQGFNRQDYFDDFDCRQAAYWAVLSGACGHTYGNNNIWQMYDEGRAPIIGAKIPWDVALDHPGAFQMGILRKLFEARDFSKLVPAQSIILDGPVSGGAKIRAAMASNGEFVIVYSPMGEKFTIDRSPLEGTYLKEIWFDPRYGVSYHIHTGDTKGIQTYTPPTSGRGQDWILILEDQALDMPLPGHH